MTSFCKLNQRGLKEMNPSLRLFLVGHYTFKTDAFLLFKEGEISTLLQLNLKFPTEPH